MAKKTKKIETPIDQRETFVSIQKNFADSDLSVSEKLKTLYALQQADTEIDKILQLRGELPMEVEHLETEIAELKAKSARIAEQIEAYTKSIAENKHNVSECEDQIEKYKAQIDNVANSREYDSLNKEIENQDLLRQIAEKNITETRELIFDKKNEAEIVKEKISVRQDDLKAKKEELSTIVESTAKEEEKLRAAREACAAKIDARTMSAYDRIRKSCNNHLAVVSVFNNDSCGGCFNTISPQRLIDIASNKKMIICEYCGRILVNPDFE
ncbi:MAG: zinc ribbon domain-containing protein [Candidatus Cryptobacteroides sp.]